MIAACLVVQVSLEGWLLQHCHFPYLLEDTGFLLLPVQ